MIWIDCKDGNNEGNVSFLIMLVVNNCINIDAIIFDSHFQIVIERAEEYGR